MIAEGPRSYIREWRYDRGENNSGNASTSLTSKIAFLVVLVCWYRRGFGLSVSDNDESVEDARLPRKSEPKARQLRVEAF